MKSRHLFWVLLPAVCLAGASLYGQAGRRAAPPPKKVDQCILHEPIHGSLTGQVAKFQMVSMPFSVAGLNAQEQKWFTSWWRRRDTLTTSTGGRTIPRV